MKKYVKAFFWVFFLPARLLFGVILPPMALTFALHEWAHDKPYDYFVDAARDGFCNIWRNKWLLP